MYKWIIRCWVKLQKRTTNIFCGQSWFRRDCKCCHIEPFFFSSKNFLLKKCDWQPCVCYSGATLTQLAGNFSGKPLHDEVSTTSTYFLMLVRWTTGKLRKRDILHQMTAPFSVSVPSKCDGWIRRGVCLCFIRMLKMNCEMHFQLYRLLRKRDDFERMRFVFRQQWQQLLNVTFSTRKRNRSWGLHKWETRRPVVFRASPANTTENTDQRTARVV